MVYTINSWITAFWNSFQSCDGSEKSSKLNGPSRTEGTWPLAPGFASISMFGDFAAIHLSYNCRKYRFVKGYKHR